MESNVFSLYKVGFCNFLINVVLPFLNIFRISFLVNKNMVVFQNGGKMSHDPFANITKFSTMLEMLVTFSREGVKNGNLKQLKWDFKPNLSLEFYMRHYQNCGEKGFKPMKANVFF